MVGIDTSLEFKPVKIAILTVSDTRTELTDTSGDILESKIKTDSFMSPTLGKQPIYKSNKMTIDGVRDKISIWINDPIVDVIITTGGTGLTGRDITVEAISPMFDKVIDGFSVIFHQESFKSIGLSTLQSRACAGLAKGTIIFCLPGSNGAVRDGWDKVISAQLDSRHRPCNMIDLMPRFGEC